MNAFIIYFHMVSKQAVVCSGILESSKMHMNVSDGFIFSDLQNSRT